MIAIIRIAGLVKMKREKTETLNRLRLRKKYVCVIAKENPYTFGAIRKIRNFVAYGNLDEETLAKLIETRGRKIRKKKAKIENVEKIVKEILAGKPLEELGLKPFFRLHPPRKGVDTKHHYPKGVLGNHGKEINKLIERML